MAKAAKQEAVPESAKTGFDLDGLKRRRDAAWVQRAVWESIYGEAYRWAMPFRRPTGNVSGAERTAHLFDNTGVVSAFHGAGQLQQDLFPPGQPLFKLEAGPISKALVRKSRKLPLPDRAIPPDEGEVDATKFERDLDEVSEQIQPFFQTGDWDNAVSELCLDLYVGTAVMLLLEGDEKTPIRFVTIPVDEVALEGGAYGDVGALYWKTKMSRRAIKAAFPKGVFDADFIKQLTDAPDDEVELFQDFIQCKGGWELVVSLGTSKEPISRQKYRTQPFIAPRYFRVPGETMGRGPVLLALPSIKTVNKVMELTLKSAAIQMLGIWGYRPGGTFNPDTSSLAPGAMWPMQSTGGVMGPDVSRLDVSAGRMDVSNVVLQELRQQIQAALHDEQLPNSGATPRSASEIMARMSKVKSNYVGAFGRMIHEVLPIVAPRVMEILHKKRLLVTSIKIDRLLVGIKVLSPMAQALKADHHKMTVEAMQLVAQIEGPDAVKRRFNLDKLLPEMIKDLGVDSEFVRSVNELLDFDQKAQAQQSAAMVAQAALAKPQEFSNVLGGGAEPQQGQGQ